MMIPVMAKYKRKREMISPGHLWSFLKVFQGLPFMRKNKNQLNEIGLSFFLASDWMVSVETRWSIDSRMAAY
jgi:hypothetical protein